MVPEPPVTCAELPQPAVASCWHRTATVFHRLLSLVHPQKEPQLAFLFPLLIADLVFIGLFVAYAFAEHYGIQDSPFFGNPKFSFVDGGYPEIYGYCKQILITLLLLAVYRKHRQAVYLALSVLFAVTLLDDSIALHEAFGHYLSLHAGISAGTGEIVGWVALGLLPGVGVLAAFSRSDARSRGDAEAVILAFAVLLFFAIGMDVLHSVLHRYFGGLQTALTIVEDGGELLSLTLISAATLGIFRRVDVSQAASPPICEVDRKNPDA